MAEKKMFKNRVDQAYLLLKQKKTLTKFDIIKELNISPNYATYILKSVPLFYKNTVYDEVKGVLKLVKKD